MALTYILHDRAADEYEEVTENYAADTVREAAYYTGPWGGMGAEIDQALYRETEDGVAETLAVRYRGRWLDVPAGQEPYISFELDTHAYDPS